MNLVELPGRHVRVVLNEDLSLSVLGRDGRLVWESSRLHTPAVVASGGGRPRLPLAGAAELVTSAFSDGRRRGHSVRLSGLEGLDLCLELVLAIEEPNDELLIQLSQVGGRDSVERIQHLYRFEKPVRDGGYMVLPHGSGYLIPADCPDELPGRGLKGGLIGARWSMPFFGLVRGNDSLYVAVESWWDCDVEAEHVPGERSALDFHWVSSLGKLGYARRLFLRFFQGMDYAAMAKLYRRQAAEQGLLRTLEEKADRTPVIQRYVENVLFRWPAWNREDSAAALRDIRKFYEMGLGINFFFPKWSSGGYSPERGTPTTANGLWQAYLHPEPVPGGWPTLVELAESVRRMGCTVQGFMCPPTQDPQGPHYDEERWPRDAAGNVSRPWLSGHDALDRISRALDNLEAVGLKFDVLYYDTFSAHMGLPEDYSAAHPMSRRRNFEEQNACFAQTRRRGIMPGAELARFWCIPECDYFFFTDWSSDRLCNTPVQGAPAPVGEPVPLFELVFHDCYIAGFSGGGYALYAPGYDWWADRTPRLYELFFASAPAYNWLPEPYTPVRDWDSARAKQRWGWLRRWNSYYRAIAMSEMVSHRFVSADRSSQRIEFASGAVVEFDFSENRFRVSGIAGFDGQWETPPQL